MATNWPPPFGLPFTLAPQLPQQEAAQPDPQGRPSDTYQAPQATEAFANPWNLPGLNLQSYGQNSQQPQYPPAAWPAPPVPNPEAWNQMQMQFPFLMQNGLVPPPPIPGLSFPPTALPQMPHQNAAPQSQFQTPSALLPQNQHPVSYTNGRHMEVVESDREDGEVSEGDRPSQSPAGRGRAHAQPPRSVPVNTLRSENKPAMVEEPYSPEDPAAGQKLHSALSSKAQTDAASSSESIPQRREDAKQFVRLLHKNNIGYHALAAEDLDAGRLRDLYQSLNLPSEPEPVPPPKAAGNVLSGATNGQPTVDQFASGSTNGAKPDTSIKTNVAVVPPAKAAPSPVDRKDYIARLQAAKMAKQGGAKTTPPQKTPPSTFTAPPAADAPQTPAATEAGKPLTEQEKKARTTELIRKRLEALKNNSSSPAAPSAPKPTTAGPVSTVRTPSSITNPTLSQPVPISPHSGIPGLFMYSPTTNHPSHVLSTPGPSVGGSENRKRPLASDFMEAAAPGSSENSFNDTSDVVDPDAMVTDISDGEIGGSGMDVSDDHALKHSALTPSNLNRTGAQNSRVAPIMSDFPSRPTSVNPAQSAVSTPGPQTPASLVRNQQLEDKEKELAAMKVLLQKKMKEKREKALAAATSSPKPEKAMQDLPNQVGSQPALQFASHASPQSKVVPSHNTPLPTPGGVQDLSRESKRRRKAEMESGLSSLEAEIANNAARMAQLTKEMELLAANDERMKQNKAQLVRELESLGIDTEGMPHAELQAKRDEIQREQEAAAEESDVAMSEAEKPINGPEDAMDQHDRPVEATSGIPGLHSMVPAEHSEPSSGPLQPTGHENVAKPAPEVQKQSLASTAAPAFPEETTLQPSSSLNLPEHVAKATHLQESGTPVDDEEDFYSPAPDTVDPSNQQAEVSAPQLDAKSLSEEGEVEMSESEEEYEPEEPQTFPEATVVEATKQDATIESSSASSLTSSSASPIQDEELYEPPDVDSTMPDVETVSPTIKYASSAQQHEAEDGAMDIATSSSDESDESGLLSESAAENIGDLSSSDQRPVPSNTIADDLAPELQPQASAATESEAQHPIAAVEDDDKELRFVPYESPLRHFKSYRYHPNFAQDVPGGFLSMTFSHQIDPDKPLCPNETAGTTCNDPHCPGQHFRGMNITGEKLLVQLGTANPGKTQEERQLWNDGLRGVLKDLRSKNTKDPNGIAMEISKYRRQFLKNDTRVINL